MTNPNTHPQQFDSKIAQGIGSISLLERQISERGQVEGVPTTQIGATNPAEAPHDLLSMSPNYQGEEVPGVD